MTRSMPPARPDGAPYVCLRCGERPTEAGATSLWCRPCFHAYETLPTDRRAASKGAWDADAAAWQARRIGAGSFCRECDCRSAQGRGNHMIYMIYIRSAPDPKSPAAMSCAFCRHTSMPVGADKAFPPTERPSPAPVIPDPRDVLLERAVKLLATVMLSSSRQWDIEEASSLLASPELAAWRNRK